MGTHILLCVCVYSCIHVLVSVLVCVHHLVFAPEQVQPPAVDGRADEVQAVVGNSKVQVTKAEDDPVWETHGASRYLP